LSVGGIRPAISAIAWPAERESEMLTFVRRMGFEGLEVAPVRLFGPLREVSAVRLTEWRRRTEGLGLTIPAMQGVLFGLRRLHLFRSAEEREALAAALGDVARVAAALGAGASVFGAPGLRDPGELDARDAWDIAVNFLHGVAARFEAEGTALCFEPVAPALGGRFIINTVEAAALVAAVARPGIRLQIDTGNLLAFRNGASPIAAAIHLAGHLHISEPGLAPLGSVGSDHATLARGLRAAGWNGWASVEMLPAVDLPAAICQAWTVMWDFYLAGNAA
jgi:D-psicose/D-tagatose/L-ribulose 3-epimerase